ncbi:GNAT family N-acetyltransferase [Alkalihalobacillus hwajinpoensis]|nr:GNAT family protein [Pseudalkalibacillus hwajinpoensis]MCA0993342.1 GNAT family N-acetyltransferase [Pseudalkalibacillus hwajinpoensis]
MKGLPNLETEHFYLRKINTDDIPAIFDYGSNPNVSKQVSWETHQTVADTRVFVDMIVEGYAQGTKALWGMELKSTGKLVGTIDFVTIQERHRKAEIGYVLSEDCCGKGYMTEAARRIIAFGFEELQLERIQARCFVDNEGSARVMEKVGMSYEGTMRSAMFAKGKFRDLKMYAIVSEDYLKCRNNNIKRCE